MEVVYLTQSAEDEGGEKKSHEGDTLYSESCPAVQDYVNSPTFQTQSCELVRKQSCESEGQLGVT